jgi:hypothetical protein
VVRWVWGWSSGGRGGEHQSGGGRDRVWAPKWRCRNRFTLSPTFTACHTPRIFTPMPIEQRCWGMGGYAGEQTVVV